MLALNMDTAKKEEVINSGQEWLDKDIFRTEVSDYSNSATIHLSTLDRFKDTKPGMYAMTSLKKMTGTDAFLDLPENIKGCQIEDQDKCYSRRYIEELQNQCKCLPWALGAIVPQKVFNPTSFVLINVKYFRIQASAIQMQTPAQNV